MSMMTENATLQRYFVLVSAGTIPNMEARVRANARYGSRTTEDDAARVRGITAEVDEPTNDETPNESKNRGSQSYPATGLQ